MYKIQAIHLLNEQFITEHTDAKDHIVKRMMVDIAAEMYKRNCYSVSEKQTKEEYLINQREIKVESFVMSPEEFEETINCFKQLSQIMLSLEARILITKLYKIFTQQPI